MLIYNYMFSVKAMYWIISSKVIVVRFPNPLALGASESENLTKVIVAV